MIKNISFQSSGCAISKASASLMTASLKGKTKAEAEDFFRSIHEMLTAKSETTFDPNNLEN